MERIWLVLKSRVLSFQRFKETISQWAMGAKRVHFASVRKRSRYLPADSGILQELGRAHYPDYISLN